MRTTNLEKSFILHTRPFRDTSLLLNILSATYGHITLLARGAKSQRSPLRTLLMPFTPILISWAGKTDLPTVSKAEAYGAPYLLSGKALLSGLYLNELLVRLLERHNPYPNLYAAYEKTLIALKNDKNIQLTLRRFEKKLLAELGYGLQLDKEINGLDVKTDSDYYFEFGVGLKKAFPKAPPSKHLFEGKSLLALHFDKFQDKKELQDAERLLQIVLKTLFGIRPVKSLEFL